MSARIEKNPVSLPPKVNGKLSGYCTINIEEINWTTTKTFPLVKLVIVWWGKEEGNTFDSVRTTRKTKSLRELNQNQTSSSLLSACYQIHTPYKLFQSYLKNCDPLIIEVYSVKTLELVGRTIVSIPLQLHSAENSKFQRASAPIISSNRRFKLGEMVISFEIKINSDSFVLENIDSVKTIAEKDVDVKNKKTLNKTPLRKKILKPLKTRREEQDDKENIQIIGKKKVISFRDPIPKKPSTLKLKTSSRPSSGSSVQTKSKSAYASSTSSSKSTLPISGKQIINNARNDKELYINALKKKQRQSIRNFLSGMPMSKCDEDEILNEIVLASPSNSVIEDIQKSEWKPLQPVMNFQGKNLSPCSNNTEQNDTVFINLKDLELNDIGIFEVRNYCNQLQNSNFIVKCAVTSKSFRRNDSQDFISSVFDTPLKSKF